MTQADNILRVLRRHVGRENAVSAAEIAAEIGWKPSRSRDVRRIIASRREAWAAEVGMFVGTASGGGFWLSDAYDDAESVVAYFDKAAENSTRAAQAVRRSVASIGFTSFAHSLQGSAKKIQDHDAAQVVIDRLRAAQAQRGLSHRALAKALKVNVSTVSRIMAGKYVGQTPRKFLRAAHAFLQEAAR